MYMITRLLAKKKYCLGIVVLLSGWLVAGIIFLNNRTLEKSGEAFAVAAPAGPESEKLLAGAVAAPEAEIKEVAGTIKRGETLSSLLGDYLSCQDICCLAKECEHTFPVRRLRAGRPYCLLLEDGTFRCLTYEIDADEQLLINYEGEQFKIRKEAISYQVERTVVAGTIKSSLFLTVSELKELPELALRLADIFGWDIDFMCDLQPGDSFRVLVEKRYREGRFAGYGKLLAAEFVNRDEIFKAIYYEDQAHPAYYDPAGRSLKKSFLKAPLVYSRISSGYSNHRLHPVLKIYRPHRAIDYAAPIGTPVRAVANGVVTQRSYDRSNGNKIKLRHANSYETTYIHLSRFGRGIKVGSRVEQGRIIGYVGATGLATGPHLDFRVYKNGRPINPLKIERIPSAPLSASVLPEFKLKVKEYFALLRRSPVLEQVQLNTPPGHEG
jgi:murein DD-endopeptidase MepM/ murein hydrolase activator NlpD